MDSDLVSLRSKCQHFRILVIGRANAGKTTLLKTVCHSTENPEIFDPAGNRIDAEVVEGSIGRGLHDIDNQLIFKSNPQYIFHDSRGFESGSIEETDKVKSFIAKRAGGNSLPEQLHAIWYCLGTDTNRPLLEADEDFFGTDVTGKVPVIAILTKCDAVVSDAFQHFLDEGEDPVAALVDRKAQEMLDERFVARLKSMRYPPADYVQVKDMHENGDCKQLITKTAGALNNDVLRLLFVSVQQNNIDLSISYAVAFNMPKSHDVVNSRKGIQMLVRGVFAWFPHTWREMENYEMHEPRLHDLFDHPLDDDRFATFKTNVEAATAILNENYSEMTENLSTWNAHAAVIAALCICAEQTFSDGFAERGTFAHAFERAFITYISSASKSEVESAIKALALQDDEVDEGDEDEDDQDREKSRLKHIITKHRLRIPKETA